MPSNLLKPEWSALESEELRILLEDGIGGHGQVSGEKGDARFYLPLAGSDCRVALRFDGTSIATVERGPAFDENQWAEVSSAIDSLLHTEPSKIGRAVSFSSHRVTGYWRGARSGVQILPPPEGAPTVPTEMGDHPFILEFPLHGDKSSRVTFARRLRVQRRLTRLLNVLLSGDVTCEGMLTEHCWALCQRDPELSSAWVQRSYWAEIGPVVADSHSAPTCEALAVLAPEGYYAQIGLRSLGVPSDLDQSICRYLALEVASRRRFDRALFWLDLASRHWVTSMSSSYAALVTAIECLTVRGSVHRVHCAQCDRKVTHEVPGPTALFKDFFETYPPGQSLRRRRDDMYSLRSQILHGSGLIAFDEDRGMGWDPPWSRHRERHEELWALTRMAMRNYLASPGSAPDPRPESPHGGRAEAVSTKHRVGIWIHFASLASEAAGAYLVFMEARRILAQLEAAGHVDYAGGPPSGYQSWVFDSGITGFGLILLGIVLSGLALLFEHRGGKVNHDDER